MKSKAISVLISSTDDIDWNGSPNVLSFFFSQINVIHFYKQCSFYFDKNNLASFSNLNYKVTFFKPPC